MTRCSSERSISGPPTTRATWRASTSSSPSSCSSHPGRSARSEPLSGRQRSSAASPGCSRTTTSSGWPRVSVRRTCALRRCCCSRSPERRSCTRATRSGCRTAPVAIRRTTAPGATRCAIRCSGTEAPAEGSARAARGSRRSTRPSETSRPSAGIPAHCSSSTGSWSPSGASSAAASACSRPTRASSPTSEAHTPSPSTRRPSGATCTPGEVVLATHEGDGLLPHAGVIVRN